MICEGQQAFKGNTECNTEVRLINTIVGHSVSTQLEFLSLFFDFQITGGKMTSERWQHHITFTQRLVAVLVKSVDFFALYANGDSSQFSNVSVSN